MKVIKTEDKTIIDLTEDERFNQYLEKIVKDNKRDTLVMKIFVGFLVLAGVVLLLLRIYK